jgi:L-alanine-DL-glutamate epimerase-like enolase superfamily enzyme
MKISSIHTRYLQIPLGQARGGSGATELELIFVEVTLENGLTGTGFTYALTGGGPSIKVLIDKTFSENIIGSTLQEWDFKWHRLWEMTHRLGRGIALPAISAIDIAIWDLRGKVQNLPLYQVLGTYREKVPVYGSGRATHQMSIEQLIEGAAAYREEGYKAIKLRAGAFPIHKDVERIAAVREAVGSEMQIMVDVNERLTYPEALQLGRHLEQLDIYWMEEPLISDDVQGHKRLAENLNIAIATGEHLHGRFEFVQYIQQGAASVLMPDAPLVGGITECCRIATIAEGLGVLVSPHFLPELHIHIGASMKSCVSVEHFPLIDGLLVETLAAKDGFMIPPDRPGHGMKWNYEAIRQYEKS